MFLADDAFNAFGKGQTAVLVEPGVTNFEVMFLGQVEDVATVNGATVRVDGTGGKIGAAARVNDASVTTADILATNGVIHVIDKVLIP